MAQEFPDQGTAEYTEQRPVRGLFNLSTHAVRLHSKLDGLQNRTCISKGWFHAELTVQAPKLISCPPSNLYEGQV